MGTKVYNLSYNRVLVSGDWLSLEHNSRQIKRSTRYNRIRIILELPQSMDKLWDFDVKKSQILPPIILRKPLENIFARMLEQLELTQKKTSNKKRNIFSNDNTISPWVINKSLKGILSAKLFRDHKIFEELKKFNNIKEDALEDLLKDIESSFPLINCLMNLQIRIKQMIFQKVKNGMKLKKIGINY